MTDKKLRCKTFLKIDCKKIDGLRNSFGKKKAPSLQKLKKVLNAKYLKIFEMEKNVRPKKIIKK